MVGQKWVVVAEVGKSAAAKRTDSCGDMEKLELMELILASEQDTKAAAERDAESRGANQDGWQYFVMTRRDYDAAVPRDT